MSVRRGFVSGVLATVPMTVAMMAMKRWLPPTLRYPLHPRLVTEGVLRRIGVAPHLDRSQRELATGLSHFGYGGLAGAAYPLVERKVPLPDTAKGALFGLALWAVSYAGWVPAARIMPPPQRHPRDRQALIIAAHVVWGIALAKFARRRRATELVPQS